MKIYMDFIGVIAMTELVIAIALLIFDLIGVIAMTELAIAIALLIFDLTGLNDFVIHQYRKKKGE